MITTREYKGHKFQLDDSKGCYIEVTLGDQVGYMGVDLAKGTTEAPYSWSIGLGNVTPDGLQGGVPGKGSTIEGSISILFEKLITDKQVSEEHREFDREAACKRLHEYMESADN